MALTNLSQVTSSGIHTLSNYTTHNINSTGIITATEFSGNLSNSSGISTFSEIRVTGNLTVEGTTTTLDSTLTEVDRLEIGANTAAVGLAVTQSGTGHVATFEGGNVGMGTNNPLSKLHLSNTGAEGLEIYIANSPNVNVLQHYNRSASSYVTHRSNALDHRFETSGTEKLRITSAGLVGIGVSTPAERLAVVAEEDSDAIDNGLSIYRSVADDKVTINAQGGAAKFIADGGSSYIPFRFYRYNGTNLYETLTIGVDGNIGIGSNNPSHKLDVIGNTQLFGTLLVGNNTNISPDANGSGQFQIDADGYSPYIAADGTAMYVGHNSSSRDLRLQTNETDRLTIDGSTGNIGIGTDTPAANIDVQKSGTGTIARFGVGDGTTNLDIKYSSNTTTFDQQNNKSIAFETADTERLRITSNGSVGIGTNDPGSSLLRVFGGSTLLTHASANDATTQAEMISNSVLRVRPHTSNSGNLNFAQVNSGAAIGLQYTNGPGTANWDIALQPFGGQVGIGTIDAGSNKLQVNGGSAFYGDGGAPVVWGDTSYLGALTFEGAAQPVVRANSGKALIFQVNQSTEALRLKSDGKSYFSSNLGLGGQTSPASSIHINNFGNDGYELKLTGNALQFNRASNSYIDQVNDNGRIIFRVTSSNTEAMRINESRKVLINSTANSDATMVVKTLTDNNHPVIKFRGTNANGYTFFGDEYATDESQFTMGIAYSSASLVTGWGVKVSTSARDEYLSSQDTYSTKHSAVRHDGDGWKFLSNSASQTVTTGSTVTLSERFRINSGGQISIRGTNTAFDTTGDLDSLQLYYEQDSGQASIGPYSSGGSTHLSFYTNSSAAAATEKLRIASNGKVGIPAVAESSALLGIRGSSTSELSDSSGLYNQGNPCYLQIKNTTDSISDPECGIILQPRNSANGSVAIYAKRTGSFTSDLVYRVRTGSSTSAERLRIKNDGGVGIGVNNPASKVHIRSTTSYGKDTYATAGTGGSQAEPPGTFRWDNNTPVASSNGRGYKAWVQSGDAYPNASNYIDVLIRNAAFYRITLKRSHSSADAAVCQMMIYGLANSGNSNYPVVHMTGANGSGTSTATVSSGNGRGSSNAVATFYWEIHSYNVNTHDTIIRIHTTGNNNQGIVALIERI